MSPTSGVPIPCQIRGRMGNLAATRSIKDRILEIVREDPGTPWQPITLFAEIRRRMPHDQRDQVQHEAVKKALRRLTKDGLVDGYTRGWYRGVPSLPDVLSGPSTPDLWTKRGDRKPFQVHGLQFFHKVGWGDGDNWIPRVSRSTETFQARNLFDHEHEDSLFHRWKGEPAVANPKEGHVYIYSWGSGRKVTIKFWGTGTIGIYVKCSQRPLEGDDIYRLGDFLDALFQIQAEVSFADLDQYFRLSSLDTNLDSPIEAVDAHGLSKLAITFKAISGEIIRIYEKQLDTGLVMRREITASPEGDGETISGAAAQLAALVSGVDHSMIQLYASKTGHRLEALERGLARQHEQYLIGLRRVEAISASVLRDREHDGEKNRALIQEVRELIPEKSSIEPEISVVKPNHVKSPRVTHERVPGLHGFSHFTGTHTVPVPDPPPPIPPPIAISKLCGALCDRSDIDEEVQCNMISNHVGGWIGRDGRLIQEHCYTPPEGSQRPPLHWWSEEATS